MSTLTPLIRWSDSNTTLRLKVEIHSCENLTVTITSTTFSCQATSSNNKDAIYQWNQLHLYAKVHPYTATHSLNGNPGGSASIQIKPTCVYITIQKIKEEKWPRLTQETGKNNRILVDWDAVESELEAEDAIDRALEEVAKRDHAMGGSTEKGITKEQMEQWSREFEHQQQQQSHGKKHKNTNSYTHLLIHLYLIFFNTIMFCGWLYVFLSLIYISVTSTLDTTYDRLNHIVNSLQTLALAEIVHAAGHIVSGSWIGAFCLHFGRNLILMALLAPLQPLHTSYTVFALYLIFAIGEIIRYPYYLITTWDALLRMNNLFHTMLHTFFPPIRHMKKLIQLSTYARYTAPIILLPLGFITELMITYNAYPLLEGKRLPMISYNANIIILIYAILAYSLGAPYLFMSMYGARHKKLGKRINVADKVD